ncbi:MAG TPA: DMT family transporter [Phenylobacterium sp.]|nr:DMT family transporter [Phenylobacterium sp.]HVI31415.1 DMT family transporter [Phenylobacterium sp.]
MVGVAPPMALVFWRWVVAFLIVSALAWRGLAEDRAELIRRWPTVLALAATGVASFGALLYVGLQSTTALNSLVVQAAIPPLIMLFAWVALRERTGRWQVAGVALSLVGVLVVLSRGRPWDLLHLGLNRGDAVVLVGVVLYAVYSLILRRRPQVRPMSLLWATFGAAIVLLAPFYLAELASGRTMALTPKALLGVGYVAVFPSFLAYLFFNRGVELIGSARAGQYLHLQPVFGAVLAVLLLGESFHLFHAAGLALIGAGILLAGRGPKP